MLKGEFCTTWRRYSPNLKTKGLWINLNHAGSEMALQNLKLQYCSLVSVLVIPIKQAVNLKSTYFFLGQLVTVSNEATHIFNMFYCCLSVHRGIFYQGYLCSKCGLGAHKECLSRFGSCGKTGDALYTLLRVFFFRKVRELHFAAL